VERRDDPGGEGERENHPQRDPPRLRSGMSVGAPLGPPRKGRPFVDLEPARLRSEITTTNAELARLGDPAAAGQRLRSNQHGRNPGDGFSPDYGAVGASSSTTSYRSTPVIVSPPASAA